jgi:hypothetical protein
MRFPFTGDITIQGSLDGRNLDPNVLYTESFVSETVCEIPIVLSARWFSIVISGNYDLTNIEFVGRISGKR